MAISLRSRALLFAVCMAALGAPSMAAADDTPIKELQLTEDARYPGGKVALLQGTTDVGGDRFSVPGTDILQPISVAVLAKTPSDKLNLKIGKGNWQKPDREGNTGDAGQITFNFRTYDGFKLQVFADQPTPYQLLIWVGDAIDEVPPPAVMPMSVYKKQHPEDVMASGHSPMRIALFAAIALLLAGGIFFVIKRRKASGDSL